MLRRKLVRSDRSPGETLIHDACWFWGSTLFLQKKLREHSQGILQRRVRAGWIRNRPAASIRGRASFCRLLPSRRYSYQRYPKVAGGVAAGCQTARGKICDFRDTSQTWGCMSVCSSRSKRRQNPTNSFISQPTLLKASKWATLALVDVTNWLWLRSACQWGDPSSLSLWIEHRANCNSLLNRRRNKNALNR